jgi:hypothetical protein
VKDERRSNVLLRFNETPVIDNLGNYPEHLIARLSEVLRDGAVAQPDPRRKGFYDITDSDRVFFIHVSPVTGRVWLLASWAFQEAQLTRAARRVPGIIAGSSASRLFATCVHAG